jgi:hypothetical protein
MDIIKYKTQKAVAHAARAPQLFGFGLFIMFSYLKLNFRVCRAVGVAKLMIL